MVFRRASFMFLAPGVKFGTLGPKNCPGWAGDLFVAKMAAPQIWFCGRMISPGEITGVPPEGNGLHGAQEAFGQLISLQTQLEN